MPDDILNQIAQSADPSDGAPAADETQVVAPEVHGEGAPIDNEDGQIEPTTQEDDLDADARDLMTPQEGDSDEIIRQKKEMERRWGRLQNRLRNEQKKQESTDPRLTQYQTALAALLNDPTATGKTVNELRQQFGLDVKPAKEQQARLQKRQELLSRIGEPETEAFGELVRHVAEQEYMPAFQQEIEALRQEVRGLLQDREQTSWRPVLDKYGKEAANYQGNAQKLMQAAKAAGIPLTQEQALLAASEGKLQAQKRVQDQRQKTRSTVETETIPESRVQQNGQPKKNGSGAKKPEDYLRSYLRENPGQRRAIEQVYPLAMKLRV